MNPSSAFEKRAIHAAIDSLRDLPPVLASRQ